MRRNDRGTPQGGVLSPLLDFLGYTFRNDRDRYGRTQRYWNLVQRSSQRGWRVILARLLDIPYINRPIFRYEFDPDIGPGPFDLETR